MPSYVITEKCDGCKGQDRTACMYICPNDLMALDKDGSAGYGEMKAYNRDAAMCWECMCCVKLCPQQAMDVRGYADFMPLGAVVQPLRSTESIMWAVRFRNKMVKRFKFPIRNTAEGSIVPDAGFATGSEELKEPGLRTEPESLGTALYRK